MLEEGKGGCWELEIAVGVAGQGAEKAGRRDESPFSCWVLQVHGVCRRTRVQAHTCECTFFPS